MKYKTVSQPRMDLMMDQINVEAEDGWRLHSWVHDLGRSRYIAVIEKQEIVRPAYPQFPQPPLLAGSSETGDYYGDQREQSR